MESAFAVGKRRKQLFIVYGAALKLRRFGSIQLGLMCAKSGKNVASLICFLMWPKLVPKKKSYYLRLFPGTFGNTGMHLNMGGGPSWFIVQWNGYVSTLLLRLLSRWSPPSNEFLKLDQCKCGLLLKERRGWCGALVRDKEGKLKGAMCSSWSGNNLSAHASEAHALLLGFKFCIQEGFRKVEVESDASNVKAALNSSDRDLSMEGPIFYEIRVLLGSFDALSWKKIPRSCNQPAHVVAKKGLAAGGVSYWKEAGPPWLEDY